MLKLGYQLRDKLILHNHAKELIQICDQKLFFVSIFIIFIQDNLIK